MTHHRLPTLRFQCDLAHEVARTITSIIVFMPFPLSAKIGASTLWFRPYSGVALSAPMLTEHSRIPYQRRNTAYTGDATKHTGPSVSPPSQTNKQTIHLLDLVCGFLRTEPTAIPKGLAIDPIVLAFRCTSAHHCITERRGAYVNTK